MRNQISRDLLNQIMESGVQMLYNLPAYSVEEHVPLVQEYFYQLPAEDERCRLVVFGEVVFMPSINYMSSNLGPPALAVLFAICLLQYDSFNFLSQRLDNLPKTLDLSVQPKLFFPHGLNRAENMHIYLDSLPDRKYYFPEQIGSVVNYSKWK